MIAVAFLLARKRRRRSYRYYGASAKQEHLLAHSRQSEKAGAGDSTPSLATIIPKDLGVFARFLQPRIQPKIRHLDRLREQVGLVCGQQCQELALSSEPRFLVGLRVELHCRPDVFVTQNTLYRLRITLQLH